MVYDNGFDTFYDILILECFVNCYHYDEYWWKWISGGEGAIKLYSNQKTNAIKLLLLDEAYDIINYDYYNI